MSTNRRRFLRLAAAAAGTALLGSAAGCSGVLSGGGSTYDPYLYEPGSVGNRDDYAFTYLDAETVRKNEDRFDGTVVDLFRGFVQADLEDSGVEIAEVDEVLSPPAGSVHLGTFEQSEVVDSLEDAGYEDVGDERGFATYASEDAGRAFGVKGSTLLSASSGLFDSGDPREAIRALAGAKAGETPRYQEDEDEFRDLLDLLDDGYYVSGGLGDAVDRPFDDQEGRGLRLRLGEDETEVRVNYLFEDPEDVDPDEVERWLEENENTWQFLIDLVDVEVTERGRAAVVRATAETDELF